MKKLFALILALAMILSLAACGRVVQSETEPEVTPEPTLEPTPEPTPEPGFPERMRIGNEAFSSCGSYRTEMSLELSMTISVDEESEELEMLTTGVSDTILEPLKTKAVVTVEMRMMGQTQTVQVLSYIEQRDGKYFLYSSQNGGKRWSSQSVQSLEEALASVSNSSDQLELFLDSADSFEKTGTELRDGRQVDVYTGKLAGDYIARGIESSGMMDSLGGLVGVGITEDMFRDLGELPCVVAIDSETGRIAYYDMDFTDVMQVLMGRLLENMLGEEAASYDIKYSMDRVAVHLEFSLYDEVEPFEIPEEARGSAEPATESVPEATPNGQVYHSDWLGLSFAIPADWTVLDRAEIGTQLGYGSQYGEMELDEILASHIPYFDLWAGSGADTVQLMIEAADVPFSDGQSADSPAAYMDHNAVSMPEMYQGLGFAVEEENRSVVTLCGRDYECFSFRASYQGSTITQTMLCTEKDGRFFTIYITCTGEDRTEEILSLFTADP